MRYSMPGAGIRFLSTPSARRATTSYHGCCLLCAISIHALREEGDYGVGRSQQGRNISIHALREEGDAFATSPAAMGLLFLSTPSARRATPSGLTMPLSAIFLSTPSARRATFFALQLRGVSVISIHALREEGDPRGHFIAPPRFDFYPRPPRGGRHNGRTNTAACPPFLSTPSARRATARIPTEHTRSFDFYPRPPRGGRQQKQRQNLYFQTNYTTFCTNLEEL